jgi:superfamily II DNA or RNA helicase
VRAAGVDIAGGTSRRVRIADVRARLPDVAREDLDRTLLHMQKRDELVLYRIDDPTDIRPQDEAGKLIVAGNPRHIFYLEPTLVPSRPSSERTPPSLAAPRSCAAAALAIAPARPSVREEPAVSRTGAPALCALREQVREKIPTTKKEREMLERGLERGFLTRDLYGHKPTSDALVERGLLAYGQGKNADRLYTTLRGRVALAQYVDPLRFYREALEKLRSADNKVDAREAMVELREIRAQRSLQQNRQRAQGDLFCGFKPAPVPKTRKEAIRLAEADLETAEPARDPGALIAQLPAAPEIPATSAVAASLRAPAVPSVKAPPSARALPSAKPPPPKAARKPRAGKPAPVPMVGEHRHVAARRDANIAAMALAADLQRTPRPLTDHDKLVLASYSGWGGLSIEESASRFPEGFPVPEARGLIHEYYTPSRVCSEVARVVAPLLPALVGGDGLVHALEPSAGIGRFVRAFEGASFELVKWHAVEYSRLSYLMLHALRADLDLFSGPFEAWVRERGKEFAGRLNLVVSNPPYGRRGASLTEDPDRKYREKKAYLYFLRRGLDLLARGGLGVYLIPSGFLSGTAAELVDARTLLLRRHHLSCAYRLPSGIFPGAQLVTDLLFFRSRGLVLKEPDPADQAILEGRYFKEYPGNILGKEVGQATSEDDQTKKPRWGYQVVGEFTSLPELRERPICHACTGEALVLAPPPSADAADAKRAVRKTDEAHEGGDPRLSLASSIGKRVDTFLAAVAAQESEEPLLAWEELYRALVDWAAKYGAPAADVELVKLSKEDQGVARFISAFAGKTAKLISALTERPAWSPRYTGRADDPVARAEHLYRQRRRLTPADLAGLDLALLYEAGWCRDQGELVPPDVYYSGELWPRYDRARAEAEAGDAQAAAQARRILELVRPAIFEDIVAGVSPRQAWVPVDLIADWMHSLQPAGYRRPALVRKDGLLQVQDVDYDVLEDVKSDLIRILGWINHDKTLFSPSHKKSEEIDEVRLRLGKEWEQSFRAWCGAEESRKRAIEEAYQRSFQGFKMPDYGSAPIPLARWGRSVVLKPHQNAGARRVLANRGGLVAFDVGVGKSFTGCAIIAGARQAGWCKRPVVVVPNSILWKWVNDFKRCLPDYRVGVIGSKRYIITQGKRRGYATSKTDTPAERAATWTRFQAGEYDVVLMTYTALPRTRMNDESLRAYAETTSAIRREIRLRQRNAQRRTKMTERDKAILAEGAAAWIAEQVELPDGQELDPGIVWDDIGVDLLMVDEAQNYKNLYLPEDREGGKPKYMGGGGSGAKRSWQLDFRTASVRRRTGGAGIVLLSATPVKNSPLEIYNILQYIDHDAWSRMGITDPEQFIDRYIRLEQEFVVGTTMQVEMSSVAAGFINLPELHSVLHRYGEFKTAEEVGLKLPKPEVHTVDVDMDDRQEDKYERYVKAIERAMEGPKLPGNSQKILGWLMRMSLVAVHADLDEGYDWKNASKVADPSSPKFAALAARVKELTTCGHIVFCDNVAAHVWVRMVLEAHGIPGDRIAILNADAAKEAAERQKIAQEFNGNPEEGIAPKYDVVIANAVAYEGVDLQTRTCAIHHLDLPWEPATLQQRNGRGVRQGNTLVAIAIFYYFARRSQDGLRWDMIQGKANWMADVIKGQKRETNNPGAQQKLSREEVLVLISRDPEKTRERLAAAHAAREAEARAKIADEASRTLRSAVARYTLARDTADPIKAAGLRSEADQRIEDLARADPKAWPWQGWAVKARDRAMIVPPAGGAPVYDGLRIASPNPLDASVIERAEFGRTREGKAIGVRRLGSASWRELSLEQVTKLDLRPEHATDAWPHDEDDRGMQEAMRTMLQNMKGYNAAATWDELGWRMATDSFAERAWSLWGDAVMAQFKALMPFYKAEVRIPVILPSGALGVGLVRAFDHALPPTDAGWAAFLRLSVTSEAKFGEMEEAATLWWGRAARGALLKAREAAQPKCPPKSAAGPRSGAPQSMAAAAAACAPHSRRTT